MNTTTWYLITNGTPLTAVAFTFAPASPQTLGTPITITATATGGSNVQYQFWMYNANANPAWSQLQAYSTSATCVWIPAMAGDYLISVTAQDVASGLFANALLWYHISSGPLLTAVDCTTVPASPQEVNTPITISATATGGMNVQYQFWLYNAQATPTWSQLQGYSAQSTCQWTPSVAGNYVISVTALDGDTGMVKSVLAPYTITPNYLTAVSVTASYPSPAPPGMPVIFTAIATGGTNVQYQFWLYNPNASPAWSLLQDYSANAGCAWIFFNPGSYVLSVTARRSKHRDEREHVVLVYD